MLSVFRIMFDLRSEKLPCRCNLQAQDCVRLLRLISFAKIVILDLVHETILSIKQHLGRVSNCRGSALSLAWMDHHWVLIHVDVLQKG